MEVGVILALRPKMLLIPVLGLPSDFGGKVLGVFVQRILFP